MVYRLYGFLLLEMCCAIIEKRVYSYYQPERGNAATFINRYSRKEFFNHLLSYNYTEASAKQVKKLKKSKEIKEMSCYPDDNSIKMIDGILVVKLQDK